MGEARERPQRGQPSSRYMLYLLPQPAFGDAWRIDVISQSLG